MLRRRNIWFHCPACEKKLVVSAEAGGFRADCPECGRNIPIPARSTTWPAWLGKGALHALQALLVVAGVGVGWWLASSQGTTEGPEAPVQAQERVRDVVEESVTSGDAAPGEDDAAAGEINRQLLDEHVALQGRYNSMLQWMIENYRGKYPLPERLVSRLRIVPLDDEGLLHEDLVEMLRLTEEEQVLVQDIVDYVRENLAQVERQKATITEQDGNRITYSVPTFPELGALLREDLFLTLETTLGEHRLDRMVDVAGESLREQMHYFGEASRTLTFEVIQPAVEGDHPPYLLIRDGWVVPDGDSVRLTKVKETAVTELPTPYKAYRDWLPDDMAQESLR